MILKYVRDWSYIDDRIFTDDCHLTFSSSGNMADQFDKAFLLLKKCAIHYLSGGIPSK